MPVRRSSPKVLAASLDFRSRPGRAWRIADRISVKYADCHRVADAYWDYDAGALPSTTKISHFSNQDARPVWTKQFGAESQGTADSQMTAIPKEPTQDLPFSAKSGRPQVRKTKRLGISGRNRRAFLRNSKSGAPKGVVGSNPMPSALAWQALTTISRTTFPKRSLPLRKQQGNSRTVAIGRRLVRWPV
jgi:hypothetical protein